MQFVFNRDYFERRLERCRELAAEADTSSIRDIQLHLAAHYEHALDVEPMADMPFPNS